MATSDSTTVKKCPKCQEHFPKTSEYFPRDKNAKDGLYCYCRKCNAAYIKSGRDKHREEFRAQQREYTKGWLSRPGVRDRLNARLNARMRRVIKTPEYKAKRKERKAKRRAQKYAAGGTFTQADVNLQYRSQKGKCWHCGKAVGDDFHVDHLIPLARGGSNDARNIVISCPHCNLSKNNKLPQEWNGRLF